MKRLDVRFASGELSLEGVLHIPDGVGPFPAVIVCHPHSLYGGSMDNNVVCGVSDALVEASFISLKFNFRGVGGSQGYYSQGAGEKGDVDAAISFVSAAEEVDSERLGLVGYSAGAAFALPVAVADARIKALTVIAPPLSMFDFMPLHRCLKPKLMISGSRDNFIPTIQFVEFSRNLPEPKEYHIIEGADHFLLGYESRLAAKTTAFFTEVLMK